MAAPHKTVTASNEQNGTDQLNKLVMYKVHYTLDGRHKKYTLLLNLFLNV